jgi:hypothetical protein
VPVAVRVPCELAELLAAPPLPWSEGPVEGSPPAATWTGGGPTGGPGWRRPDGLSSGLPDHENSGRLAKPGYLRSLRCRFCALLTSA